MDNWPTDSRRRRFDVIGDGLSGLEFSRWPIYDLQMTSAVSSVLDKGSVNYWTGEECRLFESEFKDFADCEFAVAVANGSVALELALRALSVGPGDEVIVTSRTFFASASSIVSCGATPIFADVDRETQNVTAQTILNVLSEKTKAIICVHLAGWPCDMDPIMALSEEHQLFVIEDCAQAHGARYKGRSVGSIGHVGCWSFCQDKIITTGGEGGMVTTNDKLLHSRMWSYKDHGKSWEAVYEREHPPGFRWVHESFGTNWRMTEMQAAIGRIQLTRMAEWNASRRKNAEKIWNVAKTLPRVRVPTMACGGCDGRCSADVGCVHAAYKCYVFLEGDGAFRDQVMMEMNRRGIPCFSGTCSEVYLEKAFDQTPYRPAERLPVAQELGNTSLMFLCHPTLTDEEVAKTCSVFSEVMVALADC